METSRMFKPAKLRERQCIAIKANGEQCSGDISKGALRQATRQTENLVGATDDRAIILDIVNLLICGRHSAANIESQLDFLPQRYAGEILDFARLHDPMPEIEVLPSSRNTQMTLIRKLNEDIKSNQFPHGTLYAFTWSGLPGYVKVGCAKHGCNKRMAQWTKCYPKLLLEYHSDFAFPQRMEELVHLLLAGKRFEVECGMSCQSRYHDEWFRCSISDVRKIVEQLHTIGEKKPLYDHQTRQLTAFWKDALTSSEELRGGSRADDAVIQAMMEWPPVLHSDLVEDLQHLTLESISPDLKSSARKDAGIGTKFLHHSTVGIP